MGDIITLSPNVTYNYLLVTNKIATEQERQYMNELSEKPSWESVSDLLIMAPYITNDISSYIDGLDHAITGWRVYRKSLLENKQELVAEVDADHTVVIDYLCANQTNYKYLILPITDYEVGLTLESDSITTNWWNYCLMGIREIKQNVYAPTTIWTFDINLTSTEVVQNTDVTTFKTFARTPKVVRGDSNYQTMGISCLLGGVLCRNRQYFEHQTILQEWQKFVAETDLCVWKDRKGMIKLGTIDANPSSKYMDESLEQPTTITFNFIETGDISDIQVYDDLYQMPKDALHNIFRYNEMVL